MCSMLPHDRSLPQNRFLLFGHRGASGLAPENTLASFSKAVALGVDGVELDVRLAAGEIVVIHDERVDRTTNGSGLVAEMSFRALRDLDAGNGERIPTLAEVLAAVPDDVTINVELKGADTAAPVAAMLAGQRRPLLVSSFDHAALARFHAACPDIPCAPLLGRWRRDAQAVAAALDAWAVNIADRIATPAHVGAIRGWGCRCLVFTVADPDRLRQLEAIGANGVFTDYPDRLASACRRSNSRSRP